jgi:dTDP-glucose 4,6-dehydratase
MYIADHCTGIEAVIRRGGVAELYSTGRSNSWKNFNIAHFICARLSELPGQPVEKCADLIPSATDRPGSNWSYTIDVTKMRNELGWCPASPSRRLCKIVER